MYTSFTSHTYHFSPPFVFLSLSKKKLLSLSLSLSDDEPVSTALLSLFSSFFLLIEFRLIEASIRVCSAGNWRRRGARARERQKTEQEEKVHNAEAKESSGEHHLASQLGDEVGKVYARTQEYA